MRHNEPSPVTGSVALPALLTSPSSLSVAFAPIVHPAVFAAVIAMFAETEDVTAWLASTAVMPPAIEIVLPEAEPSENGNVDRN